MRLIVLALCSYLIGGINPAYLLTRRKKGVDIRSCGTGNAGATNAMFALGFKPALVVMLLDVCKAALCVLAGRYLVPGNVYAAPLAGLVCTFGHIFPVWLRFRGGKGVACMCGTILALTPALVLPLLAAAFLFGVICNRASLVPTFTATAYVPMYYFWTGNTDVTVLLLVLPLLMLFTHRKNIFRWTPETPFRTMVFRHNLDECVERRGTGRDK